MISDHESQIESLARWYSHIGLSGNGKKLGKQVKSIPLKLYRDRKSKVMRTAKEWAAALGVTEAQIRISVCKRLPIGDTRLEATKKFKSAKPIGSAHACKA